MLKTSSNIAESVSASRKPHRFRSLTGCLTCRRRKKKCDETKPICTACTRNHQKCSWPAEIAYRGPRNLMFPAARQKCIRYPGHVDPSVPLSNLTGSLLSATKALELTDVSTVLLTHYLSETSNLLSSLPPGDNNPFLTVLVPLCCNDDLLMHSLLAISGSHIQFKNTGIEVYTATYHHYLIAIRKLRVCISDFTVGDMSRAIRIILALMMLSFFEVSLNISLCIIVVSLTHSIEFDREYPRGHVQSSPRKSPAHPSSSQQFTAIQYK